jgi:nucleoside-diphosphate-sugar epimerase
VTINHVLDRIAHITGRPLSVTRQAAERGDMRDTFADTTRAREDLGFSPAHSLDDGLAAECRWLAGLLNQTIPSFQ